MNDTFAGFTEAARLYAENYNVVRQVERMFEENLIAFADAVQAKMQTRMGRDRIQLERTKESCSWWIESADDASGDDDEAPFVWYYHKSLEIVSPGTVNVVASFGGDSEAERQAYAAVGKSLVLPPNCKQYMNRLFSGGLFGVSITLADGDPVDAMAGPVLAVLQALHQVERTRRAKR